MSPESLELWNRAVRSHKTAALLAQEDPDAAVSRAYYAAFYAVSALFAAQGRTFTRHAGVEAAVHRELVRAGKWSLELGEAFSSLASLRATAGLRSRDSSHPSAGCASGGDGRTDPCGGSCNQLSDVSAKPASSAGVRVRSRRASSTQSPLSLHRGHELLQMPRWSATSRFDDATVSLVLREQSGAEQLREELLPLLGPQSPDDRHQAVNHSRHALLSAGHSSQSVTRTAKGRFITNCSQRPPMSPIPGLPPFSRLCPKGVGSRSSCRRQPPFPMD